MKIVEVTWIDIVYKEAGWHHVNDIDDFIKDSKNVVCQLGYLYRETDEMIVLVDSYFKEDRNFGTIHKIPKGCIQKMEVIR